LQRGWVEPQTRVDDVDVDVEVDVREVLVLDVEVVDVRDVLVLLVLVLVLLVLVLVVFVVELLELELLLEEVLVVDVLVDELVELLRLEDVDVRVELVDDEVLVVELVVEVVFELLVDDVLDVVVVVVLDGRVVDVGGPAAMSATNASTASSMAGASPVTKQSPLPSARRNAASNALVHRPRQVTTPGLVAGEPLRTARARQWSRQAPFLPASLNFIAAQALARSETLRRPCRSTRCASISRPMTSWSPFVRHWFFASVWLQPLLKRSLALATHPGSTGIPFATALASQPLRSPRRLPAISSLTAAHSSPRRSPRAVEWTAHRNPSAAASPTSPTVASAGIGWRRSRGLTFAGPVLRTLRCRSAVALQPPAPRRRRAHARCDRAREASPALTFRTKESNARLAIVYSGARGSGKGGTAVRPCPQQPLQQGPEVMTAGSVVR